MNKEIILKKINNDDQGVSFKQLKKDFKIFKNEDLRNLDNLLRTLIKDNQIYFNSKRELYFKKSDNVFLGQFSETRHSYSFIEIVKPGEEKISYFCPQKFSMNALNGDTVKFIVISSKDKNGEERQIAKVLRIMKRNGGNILGEIKTDITNVNNLVFCPIDALNQKHKYKINDNTDLSNGNFVIAKFVNYSDGVIEVSIIEKIFDEYKALYDHIFILRKHNKSINFSKEIDLLEKDSFLSQFKSTSDDDSRIDLTNELIYTVDGISSKDLDDAVSIFDMSDHFILKVHIADVSHYVKRDSLLDIEARHRANSIYLIDYVRPMLPKFLSNDLCSLNPGEEKKTMTAEMKIDKKTGETISSKFYKSKIISKHRLTYEDVDLFLSGEFSFQNVQLEENLNHAKELSEILRKYKIRVGMIDFVLPEIKIDIDEQKEPIKIYDKYQTESEKIIEDLMVAANESVAKFIDANKISSIFRSHPKPNIEKLEELRIFAKTIYNEDQFKDKNNWKDILNFTNKEADKMTSKDLQKYIHAIEGLENDTYLKVNLIQTMEKARYETKNIGHYALGLEYYLHFTSPIRRYADLEVHRIIKEIISSNGKTLFQSNELLSYMKTTADHISEVEKETMQIERSLKDVKRARYLSSHYSSGTIFEGKIVNILSFGFFVDVNEQFQGLVRYDDSKFDLDSSDNKLQVINKTNNKIYKIYDKVNVNITNINLIHGIIDMELLDENNSKQ